MMRIFSLLLTLPLCAGDLRAQDQELSPGDSAIQTQELRLQQQRATTLRTRLLLYTDELQKLRGRFQTQKNDGALTAVDKELAGIKKAIDRLSAPATETLADDPPDTGEKEAPPRTPSSRLAFRVDEVKRQFGEAHREATLASSNPGKGRMKILNIEDAKKGERAGKYDDGRDYWCYENSSVKWTINDIQPGIYDVELRYVCEKGGGNAKFDIKAAGQTLTFDIPEGTGSKRLTTDAPGQLKINETSLDLRITGRKRPEGNKYYWDLKEVVLRPSALARPKTP